MNEEETFSYNQAIETIHMLIALIREHRSKTIYKGVTEADLLLWEVLKVYDQETQS